MSLVVLQPGLNFVHQYTANTVESEADVMFFLRLPSKLLPCVPQAPEEKARGITIATAHGGLPAACLCWTRSGNMGPAVKR